MPSAQPLALPTELRRNKTHFLLEETDCVNLLIAQVENQPVLEEKSLLFLLRLKTHFHLHPIFRRQLKKTIKFPSPLQPLTTIDSHTLTIDVFSLIRH